MEPHQSRTSSFPHLQGAQLPSQPSHVPSRTASSTPVSSPGLFSATVSRLNMIPPQHMSEGAPAASASRAESPFLHPLQTRKVRETSTATVDRDFTTGRKHINQYEVMEEIGRGQHGKVKRARNTHTGETVAIKIIPRYSKKRRLGKVTAEDPQRNTKREIAILKKIRHANVVALLEVIDDPELEKIYMVLEHVEHGEITWRKKGLPRICDLERRMIEKSTRGESIVAEEEELCSLQRKRAKTEVKRMKTAAKAQTDSGDYWSLEYGASFDDDEPEPSLPRSRAVSQAPSRTQSSRSLSRSQAAQAESVPIPSHGYADTDVASSPPTLEGTMYGAYADDQGGSSTLRARSPSMADSIISHMSSVDFATPPHDPFVDDFSYVPCFTIENARSAFRDTILGLEYLHYNGVVHRDIKPANLLWTKDFKVKISDFGVSYFGRPIREGEPDDLVSESEALDFDDDRELSKTVGTPAFFAPELCYTDVDNLDKEPPRVSEQIDIWSLGVTLYCIIFARIPFMAEDEYSMFKKIAKEDAFIPRRRLRPVFPFTDPSKVSLYKRVNSEPYRDDDDPAYEDIEDDLFDLLRRMLTRNPDDRIRLRDVKSHPWVVRGVPHAWIDETDPSRKMSGKQIEVDEKEIGRAVVPLTFLERAKSAVKKAVGKVMHHKRDHDDGASAASRRRADSSVASSAGDSASNQPSAYPRDIRRKSIRPDDYFATVTQVQQTEHPLSQSVTASPLESPQSLSSPLCMSLGRKPSIHANELLPDYHPDSSDAPSFGPAKPPPPKRHSHARSIGSSFLSLTPSLQEYRVAHTVPPSPGITGIVDEVARLSGARKGREASISSDDCSRAKSMDRAGLVFPNVDKHAGAMVALSTAVAPGSMQQPPRSPRHTRSIDLVAVRENSTHSLGFMPRLSSAYHHHMYHHKSYLGIKQNDRILTALRLDTATHKSDSEPSTARSTTPLSFRSPFEDPEGQADTHRHQQQPIEQPSPVRPAMLKTEPSRVPCPPSPTDDGMSQEGHSQPPSREETMSMAVSSSVTSFGAIATPMTSPSVVASPLCHTAPTNSREKVDVMPAYQSDPSLPALMSGASSVSADVEGDFLGNPGIVSRSSLLATTDSLTPPAPGKETLTEFPLDHHTDSETVAVRIDPAPAVGTKGARPRRSVSLSASASGGKYDDDSDSDDDGLMFMAKSKKKAAPKKLPSPPPQVSHPHHAPLGGLALAARRRDTNTSIGSTETAKKIDVHGESFSG
ncbi:hypothetical protein RB594_003903 [Gaeumannomyces avenae]